MKKISKFDFISFLMMFSVFCIIFVGIWHVNMNKITLLEIELFNLNSVCFSFILFFDWVSIMFMGTVFFISSLIMIYAKAYMGNNCQRFLWMTVFFIFFMMIMILSPSILGVLLGWDGLGIVSYCLVIYYQSLSSYNSGFITAITNRLGDSMLILSIVWTSFSGNFMFWDTIQGTLFFFLACLTKSAQFPFSAWLPAAMAAPTPISSLVHSSTLVTAGVYMLIRFYSSLIMSDLTGMLLLISLLTVLIAGLSALQEFDMKRLVALSTLGQLGFMMVILSLGYPYIAFFHLLIHALFKALLFMCAGLIIHSSMGYQDLRKVGSLSISPLTNISLNIASFSLMGVPFSSGFYSKDSLLELILCSYGGVGLGLMMCFMALVTISYSVRMIYLFSSLLGWTIWIYPELNLSTPISMLTMVNIFAGSGLNWMLMELHLINLNQLIKLLPLFMLVLGLMWHGVIMVNINYMYLLSFLMYISSLTKLMGFSFKLLFMYMKVMDQGWFEGIISVNKKLSINLSFWIKEVISSNMIYIMSLGMMMIIILII
uniref:NADH-ubiquinone oxidoreductase chain 5 n=1 Tax=Freysuila caesalpiniae TaxID=2008487 RepID=A0A344A2C5_9HEMI|nr:NADH dehydrogenase subunit 5 [Freysuila caesalpiniae]AWU48916.1 NADH dehydrogenase subunit 5 [Freysuila caesalpiniae]